MRKSRSRQGNIFFNLWKQSYHTPPTPSKCTEFWKEKDKPTRVSHHQAPMGSFFGKIFGPPEYFKTSFDLTSKKHWTYLGGGAGECYRRPKDCNFSSQDRQGKEKAICWQGIICWLRKPNSMEQPSLSKLPGPSSFTLSITTSAKSWGQMPLHVTVSPPHLQMCNLADSKGQPSHVILYETWTSGVLVWVVLEPTFWGHQGPPYSPKQRCVCISHSGMPDSLWPYGL